MNKALEFYVNHRFLSAAVGVGLMLAMGFLFMIGQAEPAQAYTDGIFERCEMRSGVWKCLVWRNYNWWEETFLMMRDGWVWVYPKFY